MEVLSRLSNRGHTIILSIHQPRIEVFNMFSQLVVLSKGAVCYQGPPTKALDHFKSLIEDNKLDMTFVLTNPADFILDAISRIYEHEVEIVSTKTAGWSFSRIWLNMSLVNISALSLPGTLSHLLRGTNDETPRPPHEGTKEDRHQENIGPPSIITIVNDRYALSCESGTLDSEVDSTSSLGQSRSRSKQRFFRQVELVNSRWWAVRPLHRKLNMLLVATFVTVLMALLQRRPEQDFISLSLQMKGLLLAFIGLPAIKNISVSFDYYKDRDIFDYDSSNGFYGYFVFFTHRFIYETSMASLEAFVALASGYFVLNCNQDPLIFIGVSSIFVLYYNTVTALYTTVFATRLGRPEARSISFLIQGFIAITCGLWIHPSDTIFFGAISWLQYLNPMYWAFSTVVQLNSSGLGDCLHFDALGACKATVGDLFVQQARLVELKPFVSVLVLFSIWIVIRAIQLGLLVRDAHHLKSSAGN